MYNQKEEQDFRETKLNSLESKKQINQISRHPNTEQPSRLQSHQQLFLDKDKERAQNKNQHLKLVPYSNLTSLYDKSTASPERFEEIIKKVEEKVRTATEAKFSEKI